MSKCSGGCDVLLERLGGESGVGVQLSERSGCTTLLGVRACRTGETRSISIFKADVGPWESFRLGESGAGSWGLGPTGGTEGGIWPPSGASLYVQPGLAVCRAVSGTNVA